MLFNYYKIKNKNKKSLRDIINLLYKMINKKILSKESKIYLKNNIGIVQLNENLIQLSLKNKIDCFFTINNYYI